MGYYRKFYTIRGTPIIIEHPYLFCAHVIQVTLSVHNLAYVDLDECQYIINKKR